MSEIREACYARKNAISQHSKVIPCAVENPTHYPWLPKTSPDWNRWPEARPYPGIRFGGPGLYWPLPPDSAFKPLPFRCNALHGPYVEPVSFTKRRGCRVCWRPHNDRAERFGFPPLQRAQIVRLACLEPVAKGLHITHWSSQDLAWQAMADGIVPAISSATIRRILQDVDLQPHRTRYWKTARWDEQFKQRAEKVLWCYSRAPRLARQGLWTVCVDEMPNCQVLERCPIRRAVPGSIEQQAFEYTRHGTVNILVFLIVHTGRMEAVIVEKKDAAHYIQALERFRQRHRRLKGVFLIQDGDPGHTAGDTQNYFAAANTWWRPRFTPVHASWLNQAEILIHGFKHRYLKRQSWHSRDAFIEHVMAAWPEYNQRYAKPIEWTWTNHKMRRWFDEHAQ